jgi:hypothetical protein
MRILLLRITGSAALAFGLILVPQICLAGPGAQAVAAYISTHIIDEALLAFFGIAAAAAFYYAVRMIVTASSEGTYTELSNSFIHLFAGFAVIACTGAIVSAFYHPGGGTVTPGDLNLGISSISNFIVTGSAGIFTLMAVISGIGMVTSQGDEAAFGKWRKVLIGNIVGVVIMVLAEFIVNAVMLKNAGIAAEELKGIAVFLLTLIGFVSVLALIVAGILLIVSIDESLRDRSKRIIIGTLITLGIVMSCYTLISMFF